jgi:hypothetical protein
MKLGRGNRDHPVAAADGATAVVEDTVVAVAKAEAEAASEGATRNSHTALGCFCSPRQNLPVVAGVSPCPEMIAPKDVSKQRGGYIPSTF